MGDERGGMRVFSGVVVATVIYRLIFLCTASESRKMSFFICAAAFPKSTDMETPVAAGAAYREWKYFNFICLHIHILRFYYLDIHILHSCNNIK